MEDLNQRDNPTETTFSVERGRIQQLLQEAFDNFSKFFFEATRFASKDWNRLNKEDFDALQEERDANEVVIRNFYQFLDNLSDDDLKKVAYLTNGKILVQQRDNLTSLVIEGKEIGLRDWAEQSKIGNIPESLRSLQSSNQTIRFLQKAGALISLLLLSRLQGNGEPENFVLIKELIDPDFYNDEEADFNSRDGVKILYNNFVTLCGVNALTDLGKFTVRSVGGGIDEGGIDSIPVSDYIVDKLAKIISEMNLSSQDVKDAASIVSFNDSYKVGERMGPFKAYALQVKILTSLYKQGVWL